MSVFILSASIAGITPMHAHASMFGDSFIAQKIDAGRGNIIQNRDNRNELLEKLKSAQQAKPLTPEERQAILLRQLSTTITNLQNIHDRIEVRAAAAETSGKDVSDIDELLVNGQNTLVLASTSVSFIISSSAATTTASTTLPYDPHIDTVNAIALVISAKNDLQQALNNLEKIIY